MHNNSIIGVGCILCVVVIWVSSSEFIQFIFQDMAFQKPLFLTYFSTALFTLYLFGFLLVPSWRKQLVAECTRKKEESTIQNSDLESVPFSPTNEDTSAMEQQQDQLVQESQPPLQAATTIAPIQIKTVIKHSIVMCVFWFIANFTFNLSLSRTSVSSNTIISTTMNGLCGTFISDLLWATAVVLTSPTTTVVGISFSIPLAILADVVLRHKTEALNLAYLGGTGSVILGFAIANASYHLPEQLKKFDQPFFCKPQYWLSLCKRKQPKGESTTL